MLPGSAFDVEFGGPYDTVLLTNFLHHFDKPTCVSLLKKVRASLKPGGKAATLEFVPNEDRVSPADARGFRHDDADHHGGRRCLHVLRTEWYVRGCWVQRDSRPSDSDESAYGCAGDGVRAGTRD